MRARAGEIAALLALAITVTAVMAALVLRAPSERVFGMELMARHHDPFTVMQQLARPIRLGVFSQPVTDIPGALLARVTGAVAAYNWLVLISFPLSAAAAYLLARHLTLSPPGATVAAMAYAFSPFHIAHAAYHPHIAQTQWIPLYLLALFRCLDHASPWAVAFLVAATMAVTLSNFYAGLIAAVITPVAVTAYWLVVRRAEVGSRHRAGTSSTRRLAITVGCLLLIAVSGMAYVSYAAGAVVANRAAFAFPRADLFVYSARWWSYLMPPAEHPLLGAAVRRVWTGAGVREGLLEQQVSLGWGIVALGFIAAIGWLVTRPPAASNAPPTDRQPSSLARVPVLVVVGVAALVCSLSPERTIGGFTFVRPSALLYPIVPMFRAYARFGVVVQLMAVLLAGIGVDRLRRAGTRRAQIVCVALVALAAGEYVVSPWAQWRDVLPTAAHRWVMQQADDVRVLDCTPLSSESESVEWLTGGRVTLLGGALTDCAEPKLAQQLAANGYTHLLVRRGSPDRPSSMGHGLAVAARFDDGEVFAVTAQKPGIQTAAMSGFFPLEHDAGWTWRWMSADAMWTIVNTSERGLVATLDIELSAFHRARRMEVRLDGRPVQTLVVASGRRVYHLGPLTVTPGEHQIVFHPVEAPTLVSDVLGTGDDRRVSIALGAWTWHVQGAQP